MKRLALAAAALLALAALAGVAGRPEGAGAADPAVTERTITVTGNGAVRSTPDRAQLSFGVETQASTAEAALAGNAASMRRVLAALSNAGVGELQTQSVSVWPHSSDQNRIEGYTASNSVSGVIGVGRAGAAIDAAVNAGANQIYGPSLTSADSRALYEQALGAAVKDARARAETLVAAAGGSLGRVLTIAESSAPPEPLVEKTAAMDAGTPIVAGQQETSANVTITFALV
jgi:uncharacterized protein YggE